MQKAIKLTYWLSITIIISFIAISILGKLTNLEPVDSSINDTYEEIRFFALPVAILLTLIGRIKRSDSMADIVYKSILTIIIAIGTAMFLFFAAFTNMCSWSTHKVLFQNAKDINQKIVTRSFGCGATDSGSPIFKICKVKNFTPYFIIVKQFDTSNIDTKVWLRVEQMK